MPGRGQGQQPLAAVGAALGLGDEAALDQLGQHARQALFGDAQDGQQVADRDAGVAADEMQRAVMRPAEAELVQDRVGGVGEVAIGEEQQVLRGADVLLAQEQQVAARLRLGVRPEDVDQAWLAFPRG